MTIQATGYRFPVAADETILAAAQRAGIRLAGMESGEAAAGCPARLLSGRCHHVSESEVIAADGVILHPLIELRQAVADSDLLIAARDVAHLDELAPRRVRVEVAEKRRLAPEVTGLFLRPLQGETPLHWLSGQYLEFVLEDGSRKPFSIAGVPRLDGLVELHLRQTGSSGFTAWVQHEAALGARLEIEGPRGILVPREDSARPMLFVAGGTGFAPLKAIIEYFLHRGSQRPMHLYWGVRSAEDIYLPELIDGWIAGASALRFHPCVADPQQAAADGLRAGQVHEAVLADHPSLALFDVYMSGPAPMIAVAKRAFMLGGLPSERLYYDSFDYDPAILQTVLRARRGAGG